MKYQDPMNPPPIQDSETCCQTKQLTHRLFVLCQRFAATRDLTLIEDISNVSAALVGLGYTPIFMQKKRALVLNAQSFALSLAMKGRLDEYEQELRQGLSQ